MFNRDLSIMVTQYYIQTMRESKAITNNGVVIDALSASGLRAIRYSKEIEGLEKVISNDISDSA